MICVFLTGLVGIDTNLTMSFQVFTLLLSIFLLSSVSAILNAARHQRTLRIAVERILPRFGTAGERITYRVIVQNLTDTPLESMAYIEKLPDPRPGKEEFLNTRIKNEASQPFIDRIFGLYRWSKLVEQKKVIVASERIIPAIPARGEIAFDMDLMPLKRGHVHLSGVVFAQSESFGLVRNLTKVQAAQSLIILPKRYFLPPYTLPGKQRYQQGGLALASSVGESEEFVSLREYRPGDPLRRIHWRSWAKLGTPIVKEYQDEFFVRHALILDTFVTDESEAVFEDAISVAASFACTLQNQDSILDLMFVGTKAFHMTTGRGISNTEKVLEVLASVSPCPSLSFVNLKDLVLQHMVNFSGSICIFIKWDEERSELVKQLDESGIPTEVFIITDNDTMESITSAPLSSNHFHILRSGKIQEDLQKK